MTLASLLGVVGSLGLVLALLMLTLRVLKRIAPATGGATMPLSVVQRMAVGPRQSIAIIRMGERVVAVSTGDGGVRLIADLGTPAADNKETRNSDAATSGANAAPVARPTFRSAFRTALRNAVLPALALTLALTLAATSVASAQSETPPASTPPAAAQQKMIAPTAKAPSAAALARVDSMALRAAPQMQLSIGSDKSGGLKMSGTVGIVVMMGLLTLLPALVLMMTGFTRILIVLHFLRQAIGAQSAPPAQLVSGMALLLTLFVMAPTLDEVNRTALSPWMAGRMDQMQALKEGVKPFRSFMLRQTRESDLATFVELSHAPRPSSVEEVPLVVLTSAFVTSELRVSFQIGFALFLPFIVIDVVVASVLMSMGMMMVPPAMISLPFKLLLFVLVDGWSLVIHGLVQSFH